MSARDEAVPMVARWPAHRADVPTCSVCTEVLGTHGGPCSLPCGAPRTVRGVRSSAARVQRTEYGERTAEAALEHSRCRSGAPRA